MTRLTIYPKSHYVMPAEQRERAIRSILEELDWWKPELEKQGKYAEAQRVWQRTGVGRQGSGSTHQSMGSSRLGRSRR